jgi:hypothetical protein
VRRLRSGKATLQVLAEEVLLLDTGADEAERGVA